MFESLLSSSHTLFFSNIYYSVDTPLSSLSNLNSTELQTKGTFGTGP